MTYQITCLERYFLESIGLGELSIDEIKSSTGLDTKIIKSLIENFLASKIILAEKNNYKLNLEKYKETIIKKENTLIEVSQIIESCVISKEFQFNLKKIHLNKEEEVTFNALVKNMECFISNLKPKAESIKNKNVFFWGGGNYESICNTVLNS